MSEGSVRVLLITMSDMTDILALRARTLHYVHFKYMTANKIFVVHDLVSNHFE